MVGSWSHIIQLGVLPVGLRPAPCTACGIRWPCYALHVAHTTHTAYTVHCVQARAEMNNAHST